MVLGGMLIGFFAPRRRNSAMDQKVRKIKEETKTTFKICVQNPHQRSDCSETLDLHDLTPSSHDVEKCYLTDASPQKTDLDEEDGETPCIVTLSQAEQNKAGGALSAIRRNNICQKSSSMKDTEEGKHSSQETQLEPDYEHRSGNDEDEDVVNEENGRLMPSRHEQPSIPDNTQTISPNETVTEEGTERGENNDTSVFLPTETSDESCRHLFSKRQRNSKQNCCV